VTRHRSSARLNRAGRPLPAKQKRILEKAKDELHQLFDQSSQ
jgi:hypothetical protein